MAAAPPRRIVSLTPSLTEILFALGLGERVVGVGDYSRWPPQVADLPRLGGLLDPHFEQLVALRPDLVVLAASQRELGRRVRRLDIATLELPTDNLEDLMTAVTAIGERCGTPAEGQGLAARLEEDLAPHPVAAGREVMLVVDRVAGSLDQVFVAGPGTFLQELLTRLGAVNVFADAPVAYPQVGLEEILGRNPQAIVELRYERLGPEQEATLAADWQRLPQLQAVRQGAVAVIAGEYAMLPGPRLPILYRRLAEAVAPPS